MILLTADRLVAVPLAASVTVSVLGTICTIGWLLLLASVIDGVFVGANDLPGVTPTLLEMVLLLVLRGVCSWVAEVLAERASGRLREGVRSNLVRHLFVVGVPVTVLSPAPIAWHDRQCVARRYW